MPKIDNGSKSSVALRDRRCLHEMLQSRPIVLVAGATAQLGLSLPTVRESVRHLQRLGILEEITSRKRDRQFAYLAFLDLLSEGIESK